MNINSSYSLEWMQGVSGSNSNSNVTQGLQKGVGGGQKLDFEQMVTQMSSDLMNTLDGDQSGGIDKAEFSKAAMELSNNGSLGISAESIEKTFTSIDSNSDGSLGTDELISALKNNAPQGKGDMPPPPPPPGQGQNDSSDSSSLSSMLASLDTDGDGTISQSEFEALLSKNSSDQTENSSQSQNQPQVAEKTDMMQNLLSKLIQSYNQDSQTSPYTSVLGDLSA